MPVVGIDDTDSRERGMCTTYVGAVVGDRLEAAGVAVQRYLLVRCNPAVEHKTRGNAAVALHVDGDADLVADVVTDAVDEFAETDDPNTSPGVVLADVSPDDLPDTLESFTRRAETDHLEVDEAVAVAESNGFETWAWDGGRGRIGALAATGAWAGREEWTFEHVTYRESSRWGSERVVDDSSVFAAADGAYPTVWDTVDRTDGEVVCVPHTPGPVLYGIRGDEREAVRSVAAAIDAEPAERSRTFRTNQGTDAHLREGSLPDLRDGYAYRVDGRVASAPRTERGGHVFFDLADPPDGATGTDDPTAGPGADASHDPSADPSDEAPDDSPATVECVAFEPTKRFRDRVRALREGDRITACGEFARGTLKLEKFAVRSPIETTTTTPICPDCERTMESAGADQGYRCRDCGTATSGPATRPLDRDLEEGWYEVPPIARRHVAKPLVRGGFDAPVHPES